MCHCERAQRASAANNRQRNPTHPIITQNLCYFKLYNDAMNIFKHKESTMTKGITKFFMDAALFAGVASADTDLITNIMEQQGKLYR